MNEIYQEERCNNARVNAGKEKEAKDELKCPMRLHQTFRCRNCRSPCGHKPRPYCWVGYAAPAKPHKHKRKPHTQDKRRVGFEVRDDVHIIARATLSTMMRAWWLLLSTSRAVC